MSTTKKHIFVISGFAILISLMLLWSSKHNNYVPPWDEAYHLTIAFKYYEAITKLNPSLFIQQLNTNELYPPTYHIVTALAYVVWGVHPSAGIIANIPFLFIYMFSLYAIGKNLFHNAGAVIAPIISILLPSIIGLYTTALTDISAISLFTACVALTLFLNKHCSLRYIFITALCTLLLMLTRLASLSLAIPVIAFQIIFLLKKKRTITRKLLYFFILIGIPSLSLFWFIPKYTYISETYKFWLDPKAYSTVLNQFPSGLSSENLKYYIEAVVFRSGMGYFIPLFGIVAVIRIIFTKKITQNHLMVYTLIAWIYISQTSIQMKGDRYIAGILGLLVIVGLGYIFSLKNRIVKPFILLIICWQVLPGTVSAFQGFIQYRNPWNTETLILNIFGSIREKSKALSLSDFRYLNHSTINYYLTIHHVPMEINQAIYAYDPREPEVINYESLRGYDYIIVKSGGDIGVLINSEANNTIQEYILNQRYYYRYFDTVLPDKSILYVYKKNLKISDK
jgi:4-amino-4-deoxy-L-arabinose transferase-like glycosyltransferase